VLPLVDRDSGGEQPLVVRAAGGERAEARQDQLDVDATPGGRLERRDQLRIGHAIRRRHVDAALRRHQRRHQRRVDRIGRIGPRQHANDGLTARPGCGK
jgi:hypothetical protein